MADIELLDFCEIAKEKTLREIRDAVGVSGHVEADQIDLPPGGTGSITSYLAATNETLRRVDVTGDGDGLVTVHVDGVRRAAARLFRGCPNASLQLGLRITQGQVVRVDVQCLAVATSRFYASTFHG